MLVNFVLVDDDGNRLATSDLETPRCPQEGETVKYYGTHLLVASVTTILQTDTEPFFRVFLKKWE